MSRYLIPILLLLCSFSMEAQYFNQRYILDQTAMGFHDLIQVNDTFVTVGIGSTWYSPFPSKLMLTRLDPSGAVLTQDLAIQDSMTNYAPIPGRAIAQRGRQLLITGGSGLGNPNQSGFYALYDLEEGWQWFRLITPEEGKLFLVSAAWLDNGDQLLLANQQADNGLISCWVYRVDAEGNLLWKKDYSVAGSSCLPGRIIAESNDQFLLSLERGNHHLPQQSFQGHARFIRINAAGELLATWEDSDPRTYAARQMLETEEGGLIYVSRYLTGLSANNIPLWQGYIARLDEQWEQQWALKVGAPSVESDLNNLIQSQDGHYIAVGSTFDSLATNQSLTQSGLIVKFTEEGDILWQNRHYGVESNAEKNKLYNIVELPDQSLITCGESIDLFAAELPSQAWLLRLNPLGQLDSVSHVQEKEATIPFMAQVSPNPANQLLHIKIELQAVIAQSHIQILDLQGRIWWKHQMITPFFEKNIPTQNWPAGTYYCIFQLNQEVQKVIPILILHP
ncbi:MAG: T9SS type A sorting domain-containing protein [Bacteroidota bacterium]